MSLRSLPSSVPVLSLALGLVLLPSMAAGERLAIPLADPKRPVFLEVALMTGGITVEAYEGTEVLLEATPEEVDEQPKRVKGMIRIPNQGLGLTAESEANRVEVSSDWSSRSLQLELRVPIQTSMKLNTVNGGDIVVSGVAGDLELDNTNGAITATGVRGSVVASTTNGDVLVRFLDIDSKKAMSFSTFNGDVDVTFPAGLQANLRLSAGSGEIYSDFEVALEPQTPSVERSGSEGRFRVEIKREVYGKVGGGGAELRFKTFNGDIYLRRAP